MGHYVHSKINQPQNEKKHTDGLIARKLQDAYQIKMFWERGMEWQNTYQEFSWCFECEDEECYSGNYVVIKECDDRKSDQRWIFDNSKIVPYVNPNVCLTVDEDNPENRIKLRTCRSDRD